VLATGLLDQDDLWEVVAAEHPDLDAEREVGERAARDFDNAEPFVHLQCHVLVENQLFHDEPPQVRKALHALREAGLERHEALHALARHAFEQILAPMGANPVARERQYVDRLKQLIRRPELAPA
jgi:hypothetical protein